MVTLNAHEYSVTNSKLQKQYQKKEEATSAKIVLWKNSLIVSISIRIDKGIIPTSLIRWRNEHQKGEKAKPVPSEKKRMKEQV